MPPTFTMATPSTFSLMPCPETAPRICTEIRRLERSIVARRCTNGITNDPPPSTTFCPDRSVVSCPVSGLSTALPLRPVTMKAWLGPATL